MSYAQRRVAAVIFGAVAVLLLVAGLLLGFLPVTSDGQSCGSALSPGSLNGPGCADALSSRLPIAWALLGPGIVAGLGALAFAVASERREQPEPAAN